MALHPGFPAVTLGANQFDTRASLSSLVFTDASGNVRSGAVPPVASSLVTGRADMMVDVGLFPYVISRGGGPVWGYNDGTIQSPALAAAPASNSRIDLVYVKQQETAAPVSDSADGPVIGVVTGAVATSPTVPATPAGALPLATVNISAGKTATNNSGVVIQQIFPYTCISGAPLWVRSSSELSAITPALSQDALDLSTGKRWRYLAGGWTVEDTGWKSTDGWTWGSGFSPAAASYNSMAPCGYRVTNFGQHVWIQGGVAHTNGNTAESPAFLLPASLRPPTHSPYRMFGPSITLRYDGTGNLDIAGIAVTTFTYIEIDWEI